MLWTGAMHRATKDIDLLGSGDPSPDLLTDNFREVCDTLPEQEDHLVFDSTSVIAKDINVDKIYPGCNITLKAHLGTSAITVQIDIGFGDALTPRALPIPDHKTLLDLPGCTLPVYSKETVIAEKFHAMVTLGERNSRLKDFYDLWFLLTHFEFDHRDISQAINATFARRRASLPEAQPYCFSAAFFTAK